MRAGRTMGAWVNVPYVRNLIKQYKTKIFVETGTGRGNGVRNALAQRSFDKIFSVDVFPLAANKAKKAFHRLPNVFIAEDNSENYLKHLLPSLDSTPILFWLDAHFPG